MPEPLILPPHELERARLIGLEAAKAAVEIMSRHIVTERGSDVMGTGGHGLPISSRSVDVTGASVDRTVGVNVRSLAIVEGHSGATLRLEGFDGAILNLPCVTGLVLRDVPARKVRVIATSLVGTVTVATSRIPNAFGAGNSCCANDWEPFQLEATQIDGNVVTTLAGEAGFDYELLGISFLMDTDATAANRAVNMNVFRDDGTTEIQSQLNNAITANRIASQVYGPGCGSGSVVHDSDKQKESFPMVQTVRFANGQADVNLLRVTITNGQIGDKYDLTAFYRRRKNDA